MSDVYLGCMAGGCAVERPKGMRHNGRCNCLDGLDPERRVRLFEALGRYRSRIQKLTAELAEARDPEGTR